MQINNIVIFIFALSELELVKQNMMHNDTVICMYLYHLKTVR